MECIEDIMDIEEISADMLRDGKQYFALKVKGIGIVLFGLDFMYQAQLSKYEDMTYQTNSLNELQSTLEEKNIELEE